VIGFFTRTAVAWESMLNKQARLPSHEIQDVGRSGILTFDPIQYPFEGLVNECVRRSLGHSGQPDNSRTILSNLHKFVKPDGLDPIYAAIYDLFLTAAFKQPYDIFCRKIIEEKFASRAAHQRVPSVRIQMPGQSSVNYHTDEWYGHGHTVQNFWAPLTAVTGTNSLYVCDEQTSLRVTDKIRAEGRSVQQINALARGVCRPLTMTFGEIYHFNSHMIHGTETNQTEQTRVSFDFRILLDGDDRGLKDESFFVTFEQASVAPSTEQQIGVVYIGKRQGFTQVISQKYQALLCNRYAAENRISILVSETELCGFDHLPTLWNMVSGGYAGAFSNLIIFSAFLLPQERNERMKFAEECRARRLTVHFVAEDIVARPANMLEQIEAGFCRSESSREH
jgi:sporadic carbohydrate cluster protein (TIGR04323 family)